MTCDCVTPDVRELRNALGRFATGVCIVTARAPSGATAGLTVNSFSSVSLDPPLVSWCLERKAPSLPLFQEAGHFAVHVLAADQKDLCIHFSRPSEDKFSSFKHAFAEGIGRTPVLRDSLAVFECSKSCTHDAGDHLIFIGQVERFAYSARPPLLFHSGRLIQQADTTQ